MELLAPNTDFVLSRTTLPNEDVLKEATKSYAPKKKPQNKNVEYDNLGDKLGRVYVQNQDMSSLPLKKRRVKSKFLP